jgi:hypothetical protein
VLEMRNESLRAINSASSTIRRVYENDEGNFKTVFSEFLFPNRVGDGFCVGSCLRLRRGGTRMEGG